MKKATLLTTQTLSLSHKFSNIRASSVGLVKKGGANRTGPAF